LLSEGLWQAGVGRPEEYLRPDWFARFQQVGQLQFQHRLHQRDRWAPVSQVQPRPKAARHDIAEFLRQIQLIGTTANGIFGIKCHWFQVADLMARLRGNETFGADPALHDIFPGVHYVRLVRDDKVRQAISWYRAISDDAWWATGGKRPARPGAQYDHGKINLLRGQLEGFEALWDDYFGCYGITPLVVRYEALATAYQQTIAKVLDHLGVRSPTTPIAEPRLRKQADDITEHWAMEHTRQQRQQQHKPDTASVSVRVRARCDLTKRANMRTSIVVVDNFYSNPSAVREYALKQEYYYPYQSEAEVRRGQRPFTWLASRFKPASTCPFKSSLELIGRLEYLTGDCIDFDHWNLDFPVDSEGKPIPDHRQIPRSCLWNCTFHFKPDNHQELGEGIHNHVIDSWNGVGEHGWAGLIYLTPDAPLRGGLQLWRNVDPTRNYDWMTPKEQWELIDDLGNVPNRLLLCRGSIPHSGARGWGTGLADGRLYQTFFFRVRPLQPWDGVLAPV
jgi:LPS sulfotransferase NodH